MPSSSELFTLRGTTMTSRPLRVLVAEDDAEMRALLVEALRGDGFEVLEARHGSELMQLLAARLDEGGELRMLDLLVSDVRMPGWSGLDVLQALREVHARIPVILITAFGAAELHARAREYGACVMFDKPFDVDDLRTAVVNALSG